MLLLFSDRKIEAHLFVLRFDRGQSSLPFHNVGATETIRHKFATGNRKGIVSIGDSLIYNVIGPCVVNLLCSRNCMLA